MQMGLQEMVLERGMCRLPRGAAGVRASVNLIHFDRLSHRIEIELLVDNHDGEGWTLLGTCERLPGPLRVDRHGVPVTVMTCEVRFREVGGADGTELIQTCVTLDDIPYTYAPDITMEAV